MEAYPLITRAHVYL